MKGRMKPKGFGIAAPVLLAALLIAAVIVPAMSAHGYGTDDRVDRLAHDLENAVASYNEAVTGGCSEDAANYTEEIDQILTELEVLGMQVEFTATSKDPGIATVDASVVPATEQKQTRGHSISANEEQLEIIRHLWGQNITIGEYMGAPSKIHTIQLVKIQPEERLAATSELNPAPSLVTGCCEARGMGYWAATQVKVLSPEIYLVSEADVFHVTEGNTFITVNPNLQSWNIAGSSGILRGDASPTGSEAVARYQTDTMGTRETQSVLLTGVCGVKPMNGEALQMALWESDQFIVPLKQGNSCGGKGLAEEPLGQGHIFRTQMRVKDGNKTGLITYLNDGEGSSEEPDEGKPQVRFCEGAHSNLKAKTVAGGAL